MSDYLLIESRDPFGSASFNSGCSHYHLLAKELLATGSKVTLFLVQNGVLPARPCKLSPYLTEVAQQGIEILADDFSLRERGIAPDSLIDGVKAASLEVVIDHMSEGRKVLWH